MRWIRKYFRLRIVLLIAWTSFLWFGYERLKVRAVGCPIEPAEQGMHRPVANRLMPPNWRIGPNDVDWGRQENHQDLTGKYIACKLDVGRAVTVSDVRDAPIITPTSGRTAYYLKLTDSSSLPQNLNADMHLEIFGGTGAPVASNVRVLALVCKSSCWPVLEVTPSESQQLQKENIANLTVILR
jgi:hypothetical protein